MALLAQVVTPRFVTTLISRAAAEIIFTNARMFDGTSATFSEATNVLVRGNMIAEIGIGAASASAITVEGIARTACGQ